MKLQVLSTAILLTMAMQAAQAVMITIDFDEDSDGNALAAGTIVNTQFDGITISSNDVTNHPPMIFDSANPTGGDPDLRTPGTGTNNDTALGNILIISEDADSTDPDDDARGGTLFFAFDTAVTLLSIDILDMDDGNGSNPGGTVSLYGSSGLIGSVFDIPNLGNNSFQTLTFDGDDGVGGVSEMQVWLRSSGAIPAFTYDDDIPPPDTSTTVPVPGVLALLPFGLLALWGRQRR